MSVLRSLLFYIVFYLGSIYHVAGSALLHACGMGFAHFVLKSRPLLTRRVGQSVALIGGGLILSTVL